MNRTYSPVALVVDDDPNVVNRVRSGFLEETSLGVLQAPDLTTAAKYLANKDLKVDVLVTDLGFEGKTKALDLDLHDGLDLIEYGAVRRPDMPNWVLSIFADQSHYRKRADERKLPITGWFPKLAGATHPSAMPWAMVERACLVKTLKRDKDFRERARAAGIDVRDVVSEEAMAENIRKAINLPRLTYITDLPDGFGVARPIEALVTSESPGHFNASATQLGLITTAHGESPQDALNSLSELIVEELEIYRASKMPLEGYAAHIKAMLDAFVVAPKHVD